MSKCNWGRQCIGSGWQVGRWTRGGEGETRKLWGVKECDGKVCGSSRAKPSSVHHCVVVKVLRTLHPCNHCHVATFVKSPFKRRLRKSLVHGEYLTARRWRLTTVRRIVQQSERAVHLQFLGCRSTPGGLSEEDQGDTFQCRLIRLMTL